ncbi:hypothetical protein NIES4075_34550 [Tolypothrix sp. NIES-4075]|uniref:hypothetical protein n=1 Tax=Tolypothrix sp. NIES-4075 TaxID=2005459 RepID=UPI000B6656C8|nr:hypothetical protein [Tolypothrix sp. NIES-4075]GAX42454.1 hypothetical protein NIES4075_34550 [Tolypothrix sp. NIES-4075]
MPRAIRAEPYTVLSVGNWELGIGNWELVIGSQVRSIAGLPTCSRSVSASEKHSRVHRERVIGNSDVRFLPLPITHYPLPITHYPLPITHYPLPT